MEAAEELVEGALTWGDGSEKLIVNDFVRMQKDCIVEVFVRECLGNLFYDMGVGVVDTDDFVDYPSVIDWQEFMKWAKMEYSQELFDMYEPFVRVALRDFDSYCGVFEVGMMVRARSEMYIIAGYDGGDECMAGLMNCRTGEFVSPGLVKVNALDEILIEDVHDMMNNDVRIINTATVE